MNAGSESCAPEPPTEPGAAADDSDKVVVNTRFGQFEFDKTQAIRMSRGLLGFAEHKLFGLANLPDPRLQGFMLLQSLTDPTVSFLLLPLAMANGPIAPQDIDDAREALSIAAEDLAVVLLVTIRKVGGKAQFSVNLRAPVLLDARNRTGGQYVLSNGSYPVRHILNPETAGEPGEEPESAAVK